MTDITRENLLMFAIYLIDFDESLEDFSSWKYIYSLKNLF